MTDKSVARRTKLWIKRGASIRYRWTERCSDWWCASRDAKAGTPATPTPHAAGVPGTPLIAMGAKASAGDQPSTRWGTPRTVVLAQLGRARAEREWILFHVDTADLQIDRAQATARRAAADERLRSTTEEREALARATDDMPPGTAPGEENASTEVKTGRRHAEHAARLQALRNREREARQSMDEADVEVARLDEQIRIRREVAEVRVAMIEAYVRRRCSAYLNRLVRTHPDGKRLGSLIRTDWQQRPSWLQDGPSAPEGDA